MNTAASAGHGFRQLASSDGFAIPIKTALSIANQIEAGKASATVHIGAPPSSGSAWPRTATAQERHRRRRARRVSIHRRPRSGGHDHRARRPHHLVRGRAPVAHPERKAGRQRLDHLPRHNRRQRNDDRHPGKRATAVGHQDHHGHHIRARHRRPGDASPRPQPGSERVTKTRLLSDFAVPSPPGPNWGTRTPRCPSSAGNVT